VDAHWAGKAIFGLLEKQFFSFLLNFIKCLSITFKLKTFVFQVECIVFGTFISSVMLKKMNKYEIMLSVLKRRLF
jgi:hypothetical protein